jgi:hypothetical protein
LFNHDDRPRNLGKRFKIIDWGTFLHIAAGFDHRVPKSEWQKIRRAIEKRVSKYQ